MMLMIFSHTKKLEAPDFLAMKGDGPALLPWFNYFHISNIERLSDVQKWLNYGNNVG